MTSNFSINKPNFQFSETSLNTSVNLQSPLAPVSPLELSLCVGNSSSLAFVDANVSNYESLIQGITPGTEVHMLKAGQDAVTQITEVLLRHQGISSLHIFSHGSAGSLDFASSSLNANNIRAYTDQLKVWGNALIPNADILLYGCNVAENALGKTFVELIRQVTGADIAASDDLTGNATLGGDWELEYNAGSIETSQVFQAQTTYKDTLATYTVENTNDSGTGSLRDAINQANSNPGEDNIVFGSIFNDATPDTILLSSQLIINDSVTIQGTGQNLLTISGDTNGNNTNDAGDSRIFFINQGIVNIDDMALYGGRAQGGDGAREGGGGGLGAGGAIFINGVINSSIVPTQVTISNVLFLNNQAIGGKGGASRAMAGGGGGGFGGNGGEISGGGGGFGGAGGFGDSSWSISGTGGNGGVGGSGGFFGSTGGARGSGAYISGVSGGNGGNGSYGGGGGGGGSNGNGPGGNGGNGGDFGGGGGSGKIGINTNTPMFGGNGGFGGGGGSSGYSGNNRSFIGGNGGFGGGGGTGDINGQGGTFGGNAGSGGGGGAGLGGAIFIRSGSLSLANVAFNNNSAIGGLGALAGQGKGGAIFVYSDATLTTSGLTYNINNATNAANTSTDNSNTYFLSEVSILGSNNAATETPYGESTFRISRKGQSNDLMVNFTLSGSAIRGTDYTLSVGGTTITSNSLIIPANQSFVDVVVRPMSDSLREDMEEVSINLIPNSNYLITNANATVSIVDVPSVSITAIDVDAVDSTGNTGAFRISRTDSIGDLVINFTSSGSAFRGTDYNFSVAGATITNNSIVIPNGQNFVDITVTPVTDTQLEGIENITFSLTSISDTRYSIQGASAAVNITDVPVVSITADDTDAVEATLNTGRFRISRNDTAGNLRVNFARSGSATMGNDYTLLVNNQPVTSDSVIISNGQSFVDVIVSPVRDGQIESPEAITLNLLSDNSYLSGNTAATVNITDSPTISITALDASAVETTRGTGIFRISRSDSGGNMSVYFYRGGSANSSDYTLSVDGRTITSDRIDMLSGQSFVDVVVTPTLDTQPEATETIILELSPQYSNQILGSASATVNITDKQLVSITAIDADAVDSTGNTGTFRISRNDNVGDLFVDFTRSGNASTSGIDYNLIVDGQVFAGNSIIIPNGRNFVDIVVAPTQDAQVEGREVVTLTLLPNNEYSLGSANAVVGITDLPIVSITAQDWDAVETTRGTGLFRIERTDSTGELTVNFSLGGAATSGSDYTLSVNGRPITTNSVVMLNGQSFVDVVVTPTSDTQQEGTEAVTLNLTSLSNSNNVIGNASATVNITDIPVVSITAIDADAVDSTRNTGTFRISRNDTIGDLRVNFGLSGNALSGSDYTVLVNGVPITSNSVIIPNGQSFVDVVVEPRWDSSIEGTEVVTLDIPLINNAGFLIDNGSATVNITDSSVVRIATLDSDVVEATRSTGTFRISRTDSTGNITVFFYRSGSASMTGDYTLSVDGRTIAGDRIDLLNGQDFVDIVVTPISDTQQEATETVTLDLISPYNSNLIIGNASATVNITERQLVSITAIDADAVDSTGNTATFRVSRNDTIGELRVNITRGSNPGNATFGTDYTLVVDGRPLTGDSVIIPDGQSFIDVVVVPVIDSQVESSEAVTLNLSDGMYSIGNASATANITDSPIVRITALDTDAVEATRGTGSFRISRTDNIGDLTVNFSPSGAAIPSNDYTLSVNGRAITTNSVVILNGQSFVDIVVTPTPDTLPEGTENVTLNLTSLSNSNNVIGNASATVNITDIPVVSITVIDADAVDSLGNTGTFRISRNDTIGDLRVNFERGGNAINNTDYRLFVNNRLVDTNNLIIPNGQSFIDVVVEPAWDSQIEGTESVTLNLISGIGYSLGSANATVNITDASVINITTLDTDAVEATRSTAAFRISRTDNIGNVTLNLAVNGSASGTDYTLSIDGKPMTSNSIVILNGQSFIDVVVTPISDSQQEGRETVTLDLISHTSTINNHIVGSASATVNITDTPVVSITAIDADAVEAGRNTGTFRISRNDTIGDLRVTIGRGGNAVNGSDYTLFADGRPITDDTVVIASGQSFVDVVVTPTQDTQREGTETVTLSLLANIPYLIGSANATVNITDVPTVRITAIDADAVETTRTTGIFRISRNDTFGELVVYFNAPDGNASNGVDYNLSVDGRPINGSVIMYNGQSFVDVVVTPVIDSQLESTEAVTLNLSHLSNSSHVIETSSATVNITDTPVVSITAIDVDAVDSTGNTGTFRISRNDTFGDLRVNFGRSGNALNGSDYTLLVNGRPISSDNVIISNGQSFVDVVVAPARDSQIEGTETVTLNLTSGSGYSIGNTNAAATVNITDTPVVSIAALDASAVEATRGTGTFRISRTDSIGNLTVNLSAGGTAMFGTDYTLSVDGRNINGSSVFMLGGQSFVDVVVAPISDGLVEGTEAVSLNVMSVSGNTNHVIGNASATVNITDVPVISITAIDADAVDSTGNTGTFRISRNDTIGDLRVNFGRSGNAFNGSDYTLLVDGRPILDSVVIANGQSFVDVTVMPVRDNQVEGTENATLNLLSNSGYSIGNATATVNITDLSVVRIAAQDADAVEVSRGTGIFRISRTDSNGEVTVNFAVSGAASIGNDYTLSVDGRVITGNSIAMLNGQSFVDVVVTPLSDGQQEGMETVALDLISVSNTNHVIGNANATVNITDLSVVNIAAQDADAVELTRGTGTFRISRNDSAGNLTINFTLTGNASISNDYTLSIDGRPFTGNSIAMIDGQSFADIVVTPRGDGLVEGIETVTLNIVSVSNGHAIGNTNATVNISDVPIVSIAALDADATEIAGNPGTFRISRNDTIGNLIVNLGRSGNAIINSDYMLSVDGRAIIGDSVTFSNGQSFIDVVVTPNLDSVQEGNEVVTLNLAPMTSMYGISTTNSNATVNIADAPIVRIDAIDADATETPGNTGAFRISRNGTSGNLTVNFTRRGGATSGTDYNLNVGGNPVVGNSIVIADGQEFIDVTLTAVDDTLLETAETAQLQLVTGNYAINTTSNIATVTIASSDNPPIVSNISKSGNEDSIISFSISDFSSQFTDIDGDSLSKIKITSLPTNGTLRLNGADITLNQEIAVADIANLTFTSGANFNGTINFSWNASDGSAYAANDATVTLTINPINDAPVLGNISVVGSENSVISFSASDFTSKFTDIDADNLTKIRISSLPQNGTLRFNGINVTLNQEINVDLIPQLTFTPTPNYKGTTSFRWNGHDGASYSTTNATVILTINPDNSNRWEVVAGGDFDNDGKQDILQRNFSTGGVRLTNPDGNPSILEPNMDINWSVISTADFTGDGKADIFWRNMSTGENRIWEMNDTNIVSDNATFRGTNTRTSADLNWQVVSTADFNGDRRADILWRHVSTGETIVWQMNGANIVSFSTTFRDTNTRTVVSNSWQVVSTADFTGDNKADILWRNTTTGETVVWQMDGARITSFSTTFQGTNTRSIASLDWQVISTVDFNNDGKADILWRSNSTGETRVWNMDGARIVANSATMSNNQRLIQGLNWRVISTTDFNNDNKADILWRNTSTGETQLWQMDLANIVANTVVTGAPTLEWQLFQSANFYGDSKLDSLWVNSSNQAKIVQIETNSFGEEIIV